MKVFLDTNVLLSAFLSNGLCAALMRQLLESDHEILIGEPVAREFVRIAKEKFHEPPQALSYAYEILRRQTTLPGVAEIPEGIPDPDDAPIIACALSGNSELFVTGDYALLELGEVRAMPIVSPREAWERLFHSQNRH